MRKNMNLLIVNYLKQTNLKKKRQGIAALLHKFIQILSVLSGHIP